MPQTPVAEKQLFHLDLSKGMDERTRPENMPGPASITNITNLMQDQTGAWVKRHGLGPVEVSDSTGTGTYPASVRRILNFVDGWGLIADGGKLLHKVSGSDKFRTRESLMDFSPGSATIVSGTTIRDASGAMGVGLVSFASCATHDAALMLTYVTSVNQTFSLSVVERSTGAETVYTFSTSLSSLAYTICQPAVAFTADRYLTVVYMATQYDVKCYTLDLQALPATSAAMIATIRTVYTTVNTIGSIGVMGGTGSKCWVHFDDQTAAKAYISEVTAATGVVGTTYYTPGLYAAGFRNITYDGTYLYGVVRTGVATWNCMKVTASTMTISSTWVIGRGVDTVVWNGSTLYCVYTTSATLGSGTVKTLEVSTMAPGAGAVLVGASYGWAPLSHPFYCSATGKVYIHAVKQITGSTNSPHAIIDLTQFTAFQTNSGGLALPYGVFRMACMLDAHMGATYAMCTTGLGVGVVGLGVYYTYASGNLVVCMPHMTSARAGAVGAILLHPTYAAGYSNATYGGGTYIAHGGLNQYDGLHVYENGIGGLPPLNVQTVASAGNLNGAYKYIAVYRHVDSNGETTFSRSTNPYSISNVAGATGQNTITVAPVGVTNRESGTRDFSVCVDVYRTLAGGTIYYLVCSSAYGATGQMSVSATTGLATFTDNVADATLDDYAVMYRHPGVQNTPLDRYPAPCTNIVIPHKDRLFCVDPYGLRIYYSSYFVDGETPWFNPLFSLFAHGGSGPITGLASMDGRLFVFKNDAVFVIDGDGPTESQPNGTEWSPPMQLAPRYGAIDHRGIVVVPDGIAYVSTRGMELLTRSLQLKWIGDRVQETAKLYPVVTGACADSGGRIRWLVAASQDYAGTDNVNGVELVWDYLGDVWCVCAYTGGRNTYGKALQCVAEVHDAGTQKLVYSDGWGGAMYADNATKNDYPYGLVNAVPCTVETGWLKIGQQVRQRVVTALALMKRRNHHAARISLAFDYADSYTHVTNWQPPVLNALTIEELVVKPVQPQTLAVRLKLEILKQTDTTTYPIVEDCGADVLGITVEMAPLPGAPFGNRG